MKSIKSLSIPNFNTTKVEYMNYMFKGCQSLTSLDISNFDVSKIKNFDGMFSGCSKLLYQILKQKMH
jgi:surface protein